MEIIIFIGCFWELELGYTPNVYTSKLDSKPDFSFLFAYSCCFFFSFFAKHFSRCCLPDTRCVFFSSLVLKKEPFSVSSKKEKETSKKMEILAHIQHIFTYFFFFFSFFNKCIYFLRGYFERKIFL